MVEISDLLLSVVQSLHVAAQYAYGYKNSSACGPLKAGREAVYLNGTVVSSSLSSSSDTVDTEAEDSPFQPKWKNMISCHFTQFFNFSFLGKKLGGMFFSPKNLFLNFALFLHFWMFYVIWNTFQGVVKEM